MNELMKEKLARFFIFSIAIALSPLLFDVSLILIGLSENTFTSVGVKGELLIVCAGINAAAIGEFFAQKKPEKFKIRKLFAVGVCVFILGFSSLLYAAIKAAGETSGKSEPKSQVQTLMPQPTVLNTSLKVNDLEKKQANTPTSGNQEKGSTALNSVNPAKKPNAAVIIWGSIIMFLGTIVASASCVLLAEVE